jgi:putative transposase
MHYRRTFAPGGTFFFTVITEQRRPIFANDATIAQLLAAVSHVQQRHPFAIDAFVVLPDHIHTIWTLPENDSRYSVRWGLIKERFTRQYLSNHEVPPRSLSRVSKREHAVWQRRFWEHTIQGQSDFDRHVDYIHYNPVRHGLVMAARDWPHSSFTAWVAQGAYEANWGSNDLPPLPYWMTRPSAATD